MLPPPYRLAFGIAAALVLFCLLSSPVAAQVPKVDCQVGDKVIVNFRGGEYEAIVTEVLGDGAMIKADVINQNGSKENWPFGANQVRAVKASAKRDSAAKDNEAVSEPASIQPGPEVAAAESEPDRTWTSADGKFTVAGKLAGKSGNMVRLLRTNGKATRIEFDKLCEADRKYVEAALERAQAESAADPFSDSEAAPKASRNSVEKAFAKAAAEAEKAKAAGDRIAAKKSVELAGSAERPAEPATERGSNRGRTPVTPPASNAAALPIMLFLQSGFSGLIFAPLLLGGIALLVIGLRNADRYY